jgi:copper resistance protein B
VLAAPIVRAQDSPALPRHQHTMPQTGEPTQSEREHVPPDPPTAPDDHRMSYRAMARMMEMDDTSATGMVLLDRLEWRNANRGSALAWNADAWYGNDYDKLWLKTEGERRSGTTLAARSELLWDRVLARWWDLQAGMRHDSGEGASRNWVALGVQGLAPGFFNVEATAYVGDAGRSAVRISLQRDLLFTQRLVLQPELEVNLYGKSDARKGIGSGVSDAELALRLRYELRRELAPYLGVVWARRFGATASFARSGGEDPNDVQVLGGLRVWF